MNGSGRGENKNRKNWRHRGGVSAEKSDSPYQNNKKNQNRPEKKAHFNNRPKWVPVPLLTTPIPTPLCPICNKPIRDLSSSFTDKISGEAIHFDCARKRLFDSERVDTDDTIIYLGGGRFGIVFLDNHQNIRVFKIKKIIEFENKDDRAPWRDNIADHFSLT
ncbi:hypothetical protein FACS1894190_10980 [Spirochaetia bacterium]|nr:hypothetical protein FACS1894190_10980 [Spirochaetia bacterium]